MSNDSTQPASGLNNIIREKQELLDLLSREDIFDLLKDLSFNWENNAVKIDSVLYRVFSQNGWIGDDGFVNRIGRLIYSRLVLQFDKLPVFADQSESNYIVTEKKRTGKNSVIFKGRHRILGFDVILKFLRPGASDNIEVSLRKIAGRIIDSKILMPTDLVNFEVEDLLGAKVTIKCLVFPLVQGESFSKFLDSNANHFNSHVVATFIDQVGAQLELLENIGAYHGDLHTDNILVDNADQAGLTFRLIDLSYDAVGSMSLELSRNNDLSNFKRHVWSILSSQKSFIPNVSLRKFLGTELFTKVSLMLSDKVESFVEAMAIYRGDTHNLAYLAEKADFMRLKFSTPKSFRLQRYEEFTDPSIASELFVPFSQLQERINDFGNIFVSGNRGSGKSTYLASLAFFPSVENPITDFRKSFGIYFACRQGEFKTLGGAGSNGEGIDDNHLQHVIIIKIIRKTLQVISEAVRSELIDESENYSQLIAYVNSSIPKPGVIPIGSSIISPLDNISHTVSRVELDYGRHLTEEKYGIDIQLTPHRLIQFFEIIKNLHHELENTKFHILFDDIGEPYVQERVQQVVNELIINSNPIFCVKLTAEKNTYCFETLSGKALENGHDYFEQDISYSLFIGSTSGSGLKRTKLEEYFREIVNQRLEYFKYKSTDIREYLGDNPDGAGRLQTLLAYGRKDASYYGWTTVWTVADRTPRNLLELVSEIFAVGKIKTDTSVEYVGIRDQNYAIKTISEKRLQSLSQIPGTIAVSGKRVSLGRTLFEVTIAIGSTFRTYLRMERKGRYNKKASRVRQYLAIERNDLDHLNEEAEEVLNKLVTFGILDASRTAVARDDRAKKPLYVLNRIYCPAFEIGYTRDDHLKLSRGKFEQLLLSPSRFLKDGTRKLRQGGGERWGRQSDLFVKKIGGLDNE